MPKGIKPRSAIEKVLGVLLTQNGFFYNKEMSDAGEYLVYARCVDNKNQSISFAFEWLHSMLIQEANMILEFYKQRMPGKQLDDNHKHRYTVGLFDGEKLHQLDGVILTLKYPQVLEIEDFRLGVEQIRNVSANDPILNTGFFTQEQLEEKLIHTKEALEQYVVPLLNGKFKIKYRKPRF